MLDGTDTLATIHYAYDELGRLVGKTAGNANSPVLETDIEYDLHGWTTGIDVAMKTGTGGGMAPVFSETLRYATADKDNNAKRYDGNIAETAFSHRIVPSSGGTPYLQTNTWSYAYDGLKRLTGASHYPGAPSTPSLTDTERGIGYDLNGNITALKRYGASGLENDLTFTHTGNRMTVLVDAHATGNEAGTKAFAYDVNGNMTSDGRKGLELNWNVLNLVDSAAMHGSSLKYAWLSDGTKVAAKADDGSGNGVRKRYMGSFVYTSNTGSSTDAPTEPESLAWDEGRIFFDSSMAVADDPVLDRGESGTKRKRVLRPRGNREAADSIGVADSLAWITYYRDCWFAGDHLGNVRSVIDITPGLGAPRVLEQSNYLPYGTRIQSPNLASMTDNRWRYAAKEAQHFGFLDISLLDFGARMYDPFIARWTTTDPLAKHFIDNGPFNYCFGNPFLYFDSSGCFPWAVYGVDLAAEVILISTGVITVGFLLKSNSDGSISFNWSPGYDWQRRKEREASNKAREDDLNHQKMLNNNGNDGKPKFFAVLDAIAKLLDTNRPLLGNEEKTTEQKPSTSQPEFSPAPRATPSAEQTNEVEQDLIKLLNLSPEYE